MRQTEEINNCFVCAISPQQEKMNVLISFPAELDLIRATIFGRSGNDGKTYFFGSMQSGERFRDLYRQLSKVPSV